MPRDFRRSYSRSPRRSRSRTRSRSADRYRGSGGGDRDRDRDRHNSNRDRDRGGGGGGRDRSRSRSNDRQNNDEDQCRVHIADLTESVSKYDIEKAFKKFGELREVWMAKNPPCFAFAVYKNKEDAEAAVREMDNRTVGNSRVRVTFARPRTKGRRRHFDPNMRCYQCGQRGHFSRDCDSGYYSRRRHDRSYSRDRDRDRNRRRSRTPRSRSPRSTRSRSRTPRRESTKISSATRNGNGSNNVVAEQLA